MSRYNPADFLKLGHSDYNGASSSNPLVEIGVIGAGAAFHVLCGTGMTAPYAIGIGVDHGTTTGLVASVKDSGIGLAPTLETTSTAQAIGLLGQTFGPGTLVKLAKGSQNTGPMLSLRADNGGSGHLLEWGVGGSGNVNGYIDSDGTMRIQSPTNQNVIRFSPATGSNNTLALYEYSGSAGLWFANIIQSQANSMKLQQAAAAPIGGESVVTLIELKGANSIGFFGAAPVAQPAAIANSTDTTNVATQFNTLLTALRNLGLIHA